MWQWEQGVDGGGVRRQEWSCSGWRLGAMEGQLSTVDWVGEPWGQQGAEKQNSTTMTHEASGWVCDKRVALRGEHWHAVANAASL